MFVMQNLRESGEICWELKQSAEYGSDSEWGQGVQDKRNEGTEQLLWAKSTDICH